MAGFEQSLGLSLQQTLSPQMQQSLQVLQVPALELRNLVEQELQANPVLEEEVQHHVQEEEKEMFKDVKSYFPKEALEALGAEMEKMVKNLKETEPRDEIPAQTREVPPLIQ